VKNLFVKSILSLALSFVILFSASVPVSAGFGQSQSITIDCVVYEVTISMDEHGNKVVIGEGGGYIATVTVSNAIRVAQFFELRTENIATGEVRIEHLTASPVSNAVTESTAIGPRNTQFALPPLSTDYGASRRLSGTSGVIFATQTSRTTHTAACRNNMTVRAYGDRFFQAVQRISSYETDAVATLGFATASAITAKLTAAIPIAAIVAIVVAAGGVILSIPFFVGAHIARGNARHYQERFIAALR